MSLLQPYLPSHGQSRPLATAPESKPKSRPTLKALLLTPATEQANNVKRPPAFVFSNQRDSESFLSKQRYTPCPIPHPLVLGACPLAFFPVAVFSLRKKGKNEDACGTPMLPVTTCPPTCLLGVAGRGAGVGAGIGVCAAAMSLSQLHGCRWRR